MSEKGGVIKPLFTKFIALTIVVVFATLMAYTSLEQRKIYQAEAAKPAIATTEPSSAEILPVQIVPAAPVAPEPIYTTVQSGETLSAIAERFGTTYIRLFSANPDISSPDSIQPGQRIRVPFNDEKITDRPLPAPVVTPVAPTKPVATNAPAVVAGSVWDSLAACESGGRWNINTGNGYYGGLQFSLSTWRGVGGQGYPHENTREEQILRGQMLQARSGWGQWPTCARKLGLL